MQTSVGISFLMKQLNIFGFGKQVVLKLQVKRQIGFTFWNHLHIADIVFSWSKSATFHIWIFCILLSILTLDDVLFSSIYLFHVLFW